MKVLEGKAYFRGRLRECCIGIDQGKIIKVKKILKGDEKYRFGNKYILPAAIDIHVHFREPGEIHKEDFFTGSESAAIGGVSCVFDMPNNLPPVVDAKTHAKKCQQVGYKANVDFGIYVALSENSRIEELERFGYPLKAYMVGNSHNLAFLDYSRLRSLINDLGRSHHISVHCEDGELVREGGRNLEDFLSRRPNEAEVCGLRKLLNGGQTNVHICHISARESVPYLANPNVTSEVTPHHLFLNKDSGLGSFGKTTPPLRRKSDQMALWRALLSGRIDVIASDHAPHTIEEKDESFEDAPPGVPGVETTLPLMLAQVRRKKIPIHRLISVMMEKPAKIMRLNKGRIEVGMDADLVVVDIREVGRIRSENLHSKCGWTPFEGFEGIFPVATFVRGQLVAKEGEIQETHRGRLVSALDDCQAHDPSSQNHHHI